VLFLALSLEPLVVDHLLRLHVEHARNDVAHHLHLIIVDAVVAVIGYAGIGSVQIDGDGQFRKISIIYTHYIGFFREHQPSHLQCIALQ